jgi:pimeloyl-ACP methyl ester carboxylesterase
MLKRRDLLATLLALSPLADARAAAADTGIVALHGKQATPNALHDLVQALRDAGFRAVAPMMPWSRTRDYDVPYAAALEEVAAAARALVAAGAHRIVVGGHSLGANAALAYVATGHPVDAVFALSPGHVPHIGGFRRAVAPGVDKAREMIGRGAGEEKGWFPDVNQGRSRQVHTTAAAYQSYFDPDGLGAMAKSAAAFPRPLPLFMAVGDTEGTLTYARNAIFARAPQQAQSVFAAVPGDHFNTVRNVTPQLLQWLQAVLA